MKYRINNWEGGVQETRPSGSDRIVGQQTFSCAHCGAVVVVPFKAKPHEVGEFCTRCHRPTCKKERCVRTCVPQEEMIARIEKNAREAEARKKLFDAVSSG